MIGLNFAAVSTLHGSLPVADAEAAKTATATIAPRMKANLDKRMMNSSISDLKSPLWLVKTKRRPVLSLKTLLSMNGRELREGGLRSQDRLGKEWESSTRRARNGFPLPYGQESQTH